MKTKSFSAIALLLVLFANLALFAQPHRPNFKPKPKPVPNGAIRVSTSVQGTLYLDAKPVKSMTVYHRVFIEGIDSNSHVLRLQSKTGEIERTFRVQPGMTDSYVINPDTATLISSVKDAKPKRTRLATHSSYVPLDKGFCGLVKIGFSSTYAGGQSPFWGQVIAGYQFSPLFSLGGGVGYVSNYSHFHSYQLATIIIYTETRKMTSTNFEVPFTTIFADVRLNMIKKRVVPYFDFNIGLSIPMAQSINGTYVVSHSNTSSGGYTDPEQPYQIRSIDPGLYVGINPGFKAFVYGRYYLDFFFGWDICANTYSGKLPDNKTSKWKSTSGFHMNIGFGF